jgi:hypothetical protein
MGFGKPLLWFMDVGFHPIGAVPMTIGIIPHLWDKHMGCIIWEFHNRFNDLLIIQIHIMKPM